MKYVVPALAAAAIAALAGCDRPTSTSSTTVVKEPVAQTTEKETIVREQPVVKEKETIVQAPAQPQTSSSTNITVDTSKKPEATEKSQTTSTTRVDTPLGSTSRTETETTKTTR